MKGMSALRSTILLTGVSLFSQVVGFVYRVILSRMVGSQVMGLYQLVLPVYSVLLSLTAIGFTAACSNLSARWQALGNQRAGRQTVQACLVGFLLCFVPVSVITATFSDAISVYLMGDARSRLGLVLLLPCVLLTGIENIHKHHFYGVGQVRPPAASETCEQLVRAGAVLGLLWIFLPQNPERTVGLIVLGMVICEVFSVVILVALFHRRVDRRSAGEGVSPGQLRRQIAGIAFPVGFTALLGNLMGAATSVMIPQRLVYAGANVGQAMSAFGVLCGMTVPMLMLPTALISAMSLVLVPRLAQSAALGNTPLSRRRVERALGATATFIIPAAGLLAVLAPPLGRLLFREPDAGAFAIPLAISVALGCFEGVLHASLNGLGHQAAASRYILISGAVQLAITWYRMGLPGVGLRGYVEGLLLSTLLAVWLNGQRVAKLVALRLKLFPWLIAPGLAALLAALCTRLLYIRILADGTTEGVACLVCLGIGTLIAGCTLAAEGVLNTGNEQGRGP